MGPMTGRAAGYCGGYGAPGWANQIRGRGLGLGWGRQAYGAWGRGRRHRYWAYATGVPDWVRYGYAPAWGAPPAGAYAPYGTAPSREQETELLRQQAEWLKQQLDAIGQRIEEIAAEE